MDEPADRGAPSLAPTGEVGTPAPLVAPKTLRAVRAAREVARIARARITFPRDGVVAIDVLLGHRTPLRAATGRDELPARTNAEELAGSIRRASGSLHAQSSARIAGDRQAVVAIDRPVVELPAAARTTTWSWLHASVDALECRRRGRTDGAWSVAASADRWTAAASPSANDEQRSQNAGDRGRRLHGPAGRRKVTA